ncbi:MAG: hypothetical protein SGPRY_011505 [Prymnesium sp.]
MSNRLTLRRCEEDVPESPCWPKLISLSGVAKGMQSDRAGPSFSTRSGMAKGVYLCRHCSRKSFSRSSEKKNGMWNSQPNLCQSTSARAL